MSRPRTERVASILLAGFLAAACFEHAEEAPSDSSNARPGDVALLEDLPSEVTDVVALDAIADILPEAELEVVDFFLKEKATAQEQATVLARHKRLLEGAGSDDSPAVEPRRLESLGITLVDPRPVSERLARGREAVEEQVCEGIEPVADRTASGERHNLIVFYARSVLGLCGGEVDWQPDGASAGIEDFYTLFADGNYYKNLDTYLEDFRNEPFMRRQNLFIAVYFQYLRLAFEARSIDFPRREFVDRRLDLHESYPELRYLSEYFAVMVRAGLAS